MGGLQITRDNLKDLQWLLQHGSRRRVPPVSTADIQWLNTAETARRLGVTPRTLYRFIDDGQLPAYRFGRVIRLKESEVAEFIDRCRIEPGSLDTAGLGSAGDDDDQASTDAQATAPSDA
jgi:excisionase family DNA binding protein